MATKSLTRLGSTATADDHLNVWGAGWAFYYSPVRGLRLANVLGALVTAALLSLGAPFWFNMLKSLSNLRDALNPKKEEEKAASASA